MQYIRSCPSCNSELRFPIDRGTLIVKCPNCNYSFKVDPDNPETFHLGRFDYSLPSSKKNLFQKTIEEISDILYLPVFFIKTKLKIQKFDLKKAIPIILVVFVFLNFYRLCSNKSPNTEIRQMENFPPGQPIPNEKDEFPEEHHPKIDDSNPPEFEV